MDESRWLVRPNEEKKFFRSVDLADETGFTSRLGALGQAPENDQSIIASPEASERFTELDKQLAERRTSSADIAAKFHQIQSDVMRANRDQLDELVRAAHGYLGLMKVDSESEIAFPNRSVNLVLAMDLQIRRARLPGILTRFDQDPDTIQTIANIDGSAESGGYFSSSGAWYREMINAAHYLGPLLGCLSPRF